MGSNYQNNISNKADICLIYRDRKRAVWLKSLILYACLICAGILCFSVLSN